MGDSLLAQAKRETIEQVQTGKAQSFTVGAYVKNGAIVGEVTYDRKLSNLWGFTAYARAYWFDLPVTVNGSQVAVKKPNYEAGVEVSKKF